MSESAEDANVWRALSEPTRREILERLRSGPRTTGELAEGFAVTRFAVMKHLKVLVEAGLVLVERRGRERFNHLNPVPIRAIQDRWLRPFQKKSADKLLQAKHQLEQQQQTKRSKAAKGKTA